MTSVVDDYLETQSTDNDDLYPCKGCGEILEEGKAFELAGQRWHLDCFRCHTCGTLLDSDANLLLLGDGSLICNNCTYSCSACNNKIEDLAILTGDQAFCSTCFRCRNCRRKIENLRYARTTQGIFCMSCHETLMTRRKKRSKAAAAAKGRDKDHSSMVTEKSLPALPPNVIPNNAFSNDRVDPDSDTPTELSAPPRQGNKQSESSSRSGSRPTAPSPDHGAKPEGLGASSLPYRGNRSSTMMSSETNGEDGFLIPVGLDPSPVPASNSNTRGSGHATDKKKDYFSVPKSSFSSEKRTESQGSTPHIAFQDKGRQQSSDYSNSQAGSLTRNLSKQSKQEEASPKLPPRRRQGTGDFKLQDAPNTRKATSDNGSSTSSDYSSTPQLDSRKNSENVPPRRSQDTRKPETADGRPSLDSVSKAPSQPETNRAIARKEVPSAPKPAPAKSADDVNRQKRPQVAGRSGKDSYTTPRTAPVPPQAGQDNAEPKTSPKLPRWSSGGDFSMDEDMARILGTDEGSSSMMRRASNLRTMSIDERNGKVSDFASPTSLSPGDDPAILKRQLRSSELRVAELERRFSTEADLQNASKKLMEKKKMVSELDTQSEIMIRQLEVLTGYVEKARETKTPVDARILEDSTVKDFVQKLERVKNDMSESIEQLLKERDLLVEEKLRATAERDRALMEFEQLSNKNAQLADMNNDLTRELQGRMKNSSMDSKALNGLGIYGDPKAASSSVNLDNASLSTGPTLLADEEPIVETGPTVVQVRKGQVKKFNWKKGSKGLAQNVAKGVRGAVVAFQQNDRGERIPTTMAGGDIGMPYNATVATVESPPVTTPNGATNPPATSNHHHHHHQRQQDQGRQGFGFFSKKNNVPKSQSSSAVSTPIPVPDASTTLFGSDLSERADFERRQIPSVVTRCIEEVELRGMDQEGIYRKTGGNSQVNMIKDGFDKDESFDISDPDLDITAVTSVLKQYFRKLPVPLLTYDVYDRVLESTSIVDESERCDHLRKTFASLPQSHRDCLEFLMFHLDRVAQRQNENLMTPKNLAVVFAPTIMFDRSIEREMTDMHAKNLAVQFVLENSRTIFTEA
ncbi:N-chimaerin-like protein [Emericellopsis cladophorae]|uniref:N-chimaerin-like protein n=1 Tax=Emericellopsis cladophorae TaxID=2686198 RepID=A0A9P9Y839_9HYPO|nr:N-chimaerin-like protein [Emericellopsis cladophorae]KAI6785191.1 N-chimaerin-like protein [Emericellopsis cladophorae]